MATVRNLVSLLVRNQGPGLVVPHQPRGSAERIRESECLGRIVLAAQNLNRPRRPHVGLERRVNEGGLDCTGTATGQRGTDRLVSGMPDLFRLARYQWRAITPKSRDTPLHRSERGSRVAAVLLQVRVSAARFLNLAARTGSGRKKAERVKRAPPPIDCSLCYLSSAGCDSPPCSSRQSC